MDTSEQAQITNEEAPAEVEMEKIDEISSGAEAEPEQTIEPKTPARRRGRKPAAKVPATPVAEEAETPQKTRGRKRKTECSPTPSRKTAKITQSLLSYTDFVPNIVGDRVLSCGEGEALGHPGRTTTKKPRKVDIVEEDELKIVQVVAGGVHSAILSTDGTVYMCGINEKGTVPADGVEPEESTDEFTKLTFPDEITAEGKIVMLAAGASFTAALTDLGSVIAWGNLRDSSGEIDVHPLLHKMKESPVIIVHHKLRRIVKICAGENHLVMLDEKGEVLTFGDGTMGQLGRSSRTSTIRSKFMVSESGSSLIVRMRFRVKSKFIDVLAKNVFASGFWTLVHGEDGKYYAFGLNNYGQLGIKVKEETTEDVGPEGQDNRELRVPLPVAAPSYGAELTFTQVDGVQHIVARAENGDVYVMGKNTDNALGLGTWTGKEDQVHWLYETMQKLEFEEGKKIAGVSAKLATSVAWTDDGDVYSWGFDSTGQLGLGLKDDDDKMVPKPEKVTSAHLDGFRVVGGSISDQHTLFLAVKKDDN
ncbi:unnamed protein product [Caenorhabditis auriculariae]|uniref:RCC1-like domain-containing protein n=1 Tax=Caenorhabditis auriculariae TaxID=2777116 RepID=A0A8S1H9M7_9PELO|nr:unnamed protein product [Caenorhabditis auriculariae]